jgi:hypothetical protein
MKNALKASFPNVNQVKKLKFRMLATTKLLAFNPFLFDPYSLYIFKSKFKILLVFA